MEPEVVIVECRYGGAYEGGSWAAFALDHDRVWSGGGVRAGLAEFDGWDSHDVEARSWWQDHADDPRVAVGPHPNAALKRLHAQLAATTDAPLPAP